MTVTGEYICVDINCHQPVSERDLVLRMISSSLDPVPFHATCYQRHLSAPRDPVDPATRRPPRRTSDTL
jgi:hypothetical protein